MAERLVSEGWITPTLVGLTGYYSVAGLASLTQVAVAVWVMSLVYGVPLLAMVVALLWFAVRAVLTRLAPPRRAGSLPA